MANSSGSGSAESVNSPVQASSEDSTADEVVNEERDEAAMDEDSSGVSGDDDEDEDDHYGLVELDRMRPEDMRHRTLNELKERWLRSRKEARKNKMVYMGRMYMLAARLADNNFNEVMAMQHLMEADERINRRR